MSNERSRDFGGTQSRGTDQGADGRRDPGEDALLELARLIGGQTDPFASEAANKSDSRYESRLGNVSRTVASQSYDNSRSFDERSHPGTEPPGARAGDGFDFPGLAAEDFGDRRSHSHSGRGNTGYGASHDEYDGDADGGEYGDTDEYEDESEGKQRRPTRLIMAVLGLAVFGSAAAYGYRTLVATAPSGPPPIIRADNSPTKMSPMNDVNPDTGRSDRAGERMAPRRDEDPVDLAAGGTGGSAGNPDVMPPSSATSPPIGGDPRRVHTVPIRPDLPDRAAPRAVQPPPAVPPPARQVTAPPAPPPQQRVAVAPPPADTAATAPPESGGFVVQLVSVRSEADAQSEFRRLQTKFSSVLTGHQPLIRRKDRGEQVFYAALVGPFGAKTDADQFCEQLKAAGGSCYVYKN